MNGAPDLVGLFEYGLECFRGFRAGNFDTIISAVRETLFGSRFAVRGWQIEFFESFDGSFHDLTKRQFCPPSDPIASTHQENRYATPPVVQDALRLAPGNLTCPSKSDNQGAGVNVNAPM